MKPGAYLTAKAPFSFKPDGGKGRAVQVLASQVFWVTNSTHNQAETGLVLISRKGSGTMGQGWPFSPVQARELFEVES